jgi:hypothetical protein
MSAFKSDSFRRAAPKMLVICTIILSLHYANALSSFFHGISIQSTHQKKTHHRLNPNEITMRKQKASDKHTARMQRGLTIETDYAQSTAAAATQILSSTTFTKNTWKEKRVELRAIGINTKGIKHTDLAAKVKGGRNRSRKRMKLYNSLAGYHSTFLELISDEYRVEVSLI